MDVSSEDLAGSRLCSLLSNDRTSARQTSTFCLMTLLSNRVTVRQSCGFSGEGARRQRKTTKLQRTIVLPGPECFGAGRRS